MLVPKIKSQLQHQESSRPLIIGISGLQGSGKSTWASRMVEVLETQHQLHAITLSLDDLYKTHDHLVAQRDRDPQNKLYQTRGQPGTHDEALAANLFDKLRNYHGQSQGDDDDDVMLRIPRFDKSRFNGEGDRAPEAEWPILRRRPDVVVFEGWCLGFQPLSPAALAAKYEQARAGRLGVNTPAAHAMPHLLAINDSLQRYCESFMGAEHFDFFVHLDTTDLRNVYGWRLQQEHDMIEARGTGMPDEQVRAFIDGYMPSYEMYLDGLRKGLVGGRFGEKGRMVRVVLDRERRVEVIEEV
ncbi:hypothetical protein ACEQ8H_007072 [Pleosporales sp. CAS-2024a]